MQLVDFRDCIQKCVDRADGAGCEVLFFLRGEYIKLESISQYGVVPDVVIKLKQAGYHDVEEFYKA